MAEFGEKQLMNYTDFLESKKLITENSGINVLPNDINPMLFSFQRDLVRYALRKGRSAIFADTGLGKTLMQLEWARLTCERAIILAPLSVARQTVREGGKIGINVSNLRDGDEPSEVNIINYEMLDRIDPTMFGAVVLDESSILKALDGKTRRKLTDVFAATKYRLCCTATPAPNDITEIANHAEFLGIMSRTEMLSAFFVHDDDGWRLKRHAHEPFFRWLASWGMSICKPSDLGYEDDGFLLPPLQINPLFVDTEAAPDGALFFGGLKGIQDRSSVRRATADDRVAAAAEIVNANSDQWILWHGLNDEGHKLHQLIPDSVLVEGSQSAEMKIASIESFQDGSTRVLITKPKIAGFGMNFQNAHRMAFVGLSDSWESYYQCIRRCWRFGQKEPVTATVVLSEPERQIWDNVQRKDKEANDMREHLIENVQEYEKAELGHQETDWTYDTKEVEGKGWKLMLGDSVERIRELDPESVGLSVFSPPFMSLYTYSPTERDIGNSRNETEFYEHFGYIIDGLLAATMPGRNCCVHVSQIPAMLARDGYIGIKDFRGQTIQAFQDRGWIYHGEVCIDKDPQAQAIRTKSKALLFVQMRKDASWLRPALADYILVFRKPGENPKPICPTITNDEWIEWARPIWYGIRESDTLNYASARDDQDERHICPLQLGTIERVIKLWSCEGDLVCSPFAGIGSEGYVALKYDRRFVGIELKQSYFEAACKNLKNVIGDNQQRLDMGA